MKFILCSKWAEWVGQLIEPTIHYYFLLVSHENGCKEVEFSVTLQVLIVLFYQRSTLMSVRAIFSWFGRCNTDFREKKTLENLWNHMLSFFFFKYKIWPKFRFPRLDQSPKKIPKMASKLFFCLSFLSLTFTFHIINSLQSY